jgi:hypothetical protein
MAMAMSVWLTLCNRHIDETSLETLGTNLVSNIDVPTTNAHILRKSLPYLIYITGIDLDTHV